MSVNEPIYLLREIKDLLEIMSEIDFFIDEERLMQEYEGPMFDCLGVYINREFARWADLNVEYNLYDRYSPGPLYRLVTELLADSRSH